jgi:hypothetical protein
MEWLHDTQPPIFLREIPKISVANDPPWRYLARMIATKGNPHEKGTT